MSQRMITSFFASPPKAVEGPGERQSDEVASKFCDLLALAEPPAKRGRGRPKGSSNAAVQDGFNAPSSTEGCPGACVDEASNLGDAVDPEMDDVLDTSTPQKRKRGKYNSLKDPKYLAVAQEAVDRALGNGNYSDTVIPSHAWIIDHYSRFSGYRFNRWTLTRLIEEAKKNGGRLQPYETALTHKLERQLKTFIIECSKTGMPLSAKDIKVMAYDLARLKDSNTKFKATNGWWSSFKSRHPDLRLRRLEELDTMRHRALNYDIACEWFDLVQQKYAEVRAINQKILAAKGLSGDHALQPNLVHNMDETGFQAKRGRRFGICEKGERYAHTIVPPNTPTVTMLACVSAAGNTMPPMFILKGVRPFNEDQLAKLKANTTVGASFHRTANGWTNYEKFVEWSKLFTKWIRSFPPPYGGDKEDRLHHILVLDGHNSHVKNLPALVHLRNERVHVICMPAHTSSGLQPLDVAIFAPVKQAFGECQSRFIRATNATGGISLTKVAEFADKALREAVGKVDCITSGFRRTGLWPLNTDWPKKNLRTLKFSQEFSKGDFLRRRTFDVFSKVRDLGENTVFDIYGIPVASTSLLKLYDINLDAKDQAWITDDIMNSMGKLICANSIRSMVMVDTNVAAMWARDTGKGRARRGSSNLAAQQAKRLLEHDVICFPCNPSSAHWSIIFIFVKERRFEYFDSLAWEAQKWKDAAILFLNDRAFRAYPDEQIDRDASTWPFVNTFEAAVQRDQINCGIWTLIGMESIACSNSLTSVATFPPEAILAFRCKYFMKLLSAAAWEEKDTDSDVNGMEESSEESTNSPSPEAQGGSRVRGGDGGESATALNTLLAEMKKMMKDLKERELAAAASTSHQTIINYTNNSTNIQIGSADARPLIEKAYGKLISSSGCTREGQDGSIQEKRSETSSERLMNILLKDVGGADFFLSRKRVSMDSWRPKDMYDLERLKGIEAQDKSREAAIKAKKQKTDKQFVEEAGVRAFLLRKANEDFSFEFARDDKITKTKLIEVLQLAGKRVSIQRSRQELLELVRSLSASSEEHVSEEASSSREPNPPQNADEVPAGTSEGVPDTMEEEDLVKAALFANAALSGYTGGKLKRCHLVSYLTKIKQWDKNFPWQAKRAQLFRMTVEFIRSFPEIANPGLCQLESSPQAK